MNKKLLFSCFSAAFLLSGICLAENLTFTGTTDKNPLLYKAGEEMRFTVTLVDRDKNNAPVPGRRLKWVRRGDDGKTESGEALSDQPLVVRTSIGKPGFVRLTVNVLDGAGKVVKGAKHSFDGGAGADVAKIPPRAQTCRFRRILGRRGQTSPRSALSGEADSGGVARQADRRIQI